MAISSPPEIPNPLQEIADKAYSFKNTATAARILRAAFGDSVVTGVEEAAPEVAQGLIAATLEVVADLIGVIVILVVIIVLALLILIHYTIRDTIKNVPIVGGPLVALSDLLNSAVMGAADWAWQEAQQFMNGSLLKFHAVVAALIATFGLPSLDYIHGAVSSLQHEINRVPFEIDTATNNVAQALAISIGSIWHNINLIWPWLHTFVEEISVIQNTIKSLWGWIHHLLAQVAILVTFMSWAFGQVYLLWQAVQWLMPEVQKLNHEMTVVQQQVHWLQQRILADEASIAPAIEAAAIMTLLSPLLENGPEGIATLQELQVDPCKCMFSPGSKGFMLTSMVMYLWWRDGV